jgi:hypothetical protein
MTASTSDGGAGRERTCDGIGADGTIVEIACTAEQAGRKRGRQPEIEHQPHDGAFEASRRNPDNRHVGAIDADALPERVRRAAKARLPVVEGDDGHRR